jgi:hypothetical protein
MNNIESNTGEIVMYQPDETIRLEVRVENETVWLTQQQIADLFLSSRTNVVEHVMHIYEDEELDESSTCRKFRQVRQEGKRTISRVVPMYNQLSHQQQLDITRHNQQYPPITVNICQRNHDRFLIIDDVVYLFGASLKDAGKKLFAYIKMQETPAAELLNNIR